MLAISCLCIPLVPGAGAQTSTSLPVPDTVTASPRAWADQAAANQLRIIDAGHDVPVRYRQHKVDARGATTREVIETRDGSVARLLDRNGSPLTTEENDAERARLNGILEDPELFLKRHRKEGSARGYATELVKQLPPAMLWSYAPGQPQLGERSRPQVVLDFTPNPRYKPPSLITEGLTGIAGRVWIDAQTRCVLRIEGRILHPVDFGWGGMLARVGQGGTVSLDQRSVGDRRWLYTHLSEDVTVREVLVHTVAEKSQVDAGKAELLNQPVSYQQAIHELLSMPVPTRQP